MMSEARRRQQSLAKRRDAIFSISAHYFYDRWLWIQFPWLALANATGASQKARGGHDLKLMSGVSNTGILSGGTMIRSSSAGARVRRIRARRWCTKHVCRKHAAARRWRGYRGWAGDGTASRRRIEAPKVAEAIVGTTGSRRLGCSKVTKAITTTTSCGCRLAKPTKVVCAAAQARAVCRAGQLKTASPSAREEA